MKERWKGKKREFMIGNGSKRRGAKKRPGKRKENTIDSSLAADGPLQDWQVLMELVV